MTTTIDLRQVRRVLITGSRSWTDTSTVRAVLASVWHPDTVLVHGACSQGVDALAHDCWTHWGGIVEQWPAGWSAPCTPHCRPGHRRTARTGSYCPTAGLTRNLAMVAAGADLCLALIHRHSRGATHCATAAMHAGIPTILHTQPPE